MSLSESCDCFEPIGKNCIGLGRKVRAPQGKVVANGNCPARRDKESATEKKTLTFGR